MSTQEKPDTLNYENIFSLFNTICTDLPRVERLTDARKRRIKTAVKALKGDFKSFFAKVQASDFLTGRETNWKSNFDWILNSNNLVKILEGNYDNRREKPYAAGNTPERAGSFAEEKNTVNTSDDLAAYEQRRVDYMNQTGGVLTGYDCQECRNKGIVYYLNKDGYLCHRECDCMGTRRALQRIEKAD